VVDEFEYRRKKAEAMTVQDTVQGNSDVLPPHIKRKVELTIVAKIFLALKRNNIKISTAMRETIVSVLGVTERTLVRYIGNVRDGKNTIGEQEEDKDNIENN
jgi:hypothetical protein